MLKNRDSVDDESTSNRIRMSVSLTSPWYDEIHRRNVLRSSLWHDIFMRGWTRTYYIVFTSDLMVSSKSEVRLFVGQIVGAWRAPWTYVPTWQVNTWIQVTLSHAGPITGEWISIDKGGLLCGLHNNVPLASSRCKRSLRPFWVDSFLSLKPVWLPRQIGDCHCCQEYLLICNGRFRGSV